MLNPKWDPYLALVNWRVVGRLHQVDRMRTIHLIPVALPGFGDHFVICSQQVPAPLASRVLEHYILHGVELSSRAPYVQYESGC